MKLVISLLLVTTSALARLPGSVITFASGGGVSGGSYAAITFFGGSPPPSFTTFILDNFVGADNTHLQDHTPDVGGAWVAENANTLQILSNQLTGDSGATTIYVNDAGVDSGTLTFNLTLDANQSELSMIIGSTTTHGSAGWFVEILPWAGAPTENVKFYEYTGVAYQGAVRHEFSAGPQVWKTVLNASAISFYVNDVLITSYANPTLHGTKWGFYNGGKGGGLPTESIFTKFQVTDE